MGNNKKKISEALGILCMSIIEIFIFIYTLQSLISPGLFTLLLVIHIFIFIKTKFNEDEVHPLLHFNRSGEGIIILITPLAFFSYIITYILEGMTDQAQVNAEFSCIYSFVIALWLFFASSSMLGVFFIIHMYTGLTGEIITVFQPIIYEQPLIIVPELILISIFAIFGWFGHVSLLCSSLKKKEYMGKTPETYLKAAKLTGISTFCIFLIIIIQIDSLMDTILKFLINFY